MRISEGFMRISEDLQESIRIYSDLFLPKDVGVQNLDSGVCPSTAFVIKMYLMF